MTLAQSRWFYYIIVSLLTTSFVTNPENVFAQCRSSNSSAKERQLPSDLTTVGLEKLLSFDLEVTSAVKKVQKISEVTSAIYVVTNEDIRRSGATHIAEALRLVPGLHVAQIDAHRWAITSRGFNSSFAARLLVLIDGQSIFTSIFNGVLWDQYDLALEDVDRIEVVRGPGAVVWGSNAVNGVINIITCNAEGTQGGLITAGGGSEEVFLSSVRYGGQINENSYYRVFGKFRNRDESKLLAGGDADDEYSSASGGFRFDSKLNERDTLAITTRAFHVNLDRNNTVPSLDPPFVDTETFSGRKEEYGTNILSRWRRELSEESDISFQLDYIFERQEELPIFPLTRHTLHFDAQHRLSPIKNHDLTLGFEFRFYDDDITSSFADTFDPESRSTELYTWFIQDEIILIEDTLRFVVGVKLEKNAHTGFEYMPNGRFLWTPAPNHSVWLAVSRALANPSRVLDDVVIPVAAFPEPTSGLTGLVTIFGDRSVEAEDLTSIEVGYRTDAISNLSFDVAAFVSDYEDVNSAEPEEPFVGVLTDQTRPALILPLRIDSKLEAISYGVEAAVQWQPKPWWRLVGTYSYIKLDIKQKNSLDSSNALFFEGGTPDNQFHLRSHIDLPYDVEFDSLLRYVDHLSFGDVDSYFELDLRLGWQVMKSMEVEVVGQNLLDKDHVEFQGTILPPPTVAIQRGVYGKVKVTF